MQYSTCILMAVCASELESDVGSLVVLSLPILQPWSGLDVSARTMHLFTKHMELRGNVFMESGKDVVFNFNTHAEKAVRGGRCKKTEGKAGLSQAHRDTKEKKQNRQTGREPEQRKKST